MPYQFPAAGEPEPVVPPTELSRKEVKIRSLGVVPEEKSAVPDGTLMRPYTPSEPSHPFTIVPGGGYWSATTDASSTSNAWFVALDFFGVVAAQVKTVSSYYVWCVRGGQGVDPQ